MDKIMFIILLLSITILATPTVLGYNQDFRPPYTPLYNPGAPATSPGDQPNAYLKARPDNRIPTELERFRSKSPPPNSNYQSQCQFGACLPSGEPTQRLDFK
jgi:hypothetical protein